MSQTIRKNMFVRLLYALLYTLYLCSMFLFQEIVCFGTEELSDNNELFKYRSSRHEWDRSVRGFRRDHNFSISAGKSSGSWRMRYGPSDGSTRTISNRSRFGKFQYSFHIEIYKGLGYYLGSSLVSSYSEKQFSKDEDVYYSRSFSLPGMVIGVVYNFSPLFRISFGIDGYLERVEKLVFRDGSANTIPINITARGLSPHLAVDFFLRLDSALRIEAEYKNLAYRFPNNTYDDAPLSNSFDSREFLFSLGWIFHLI
ncbi:MAG: hypothetical protein HQK54_03270 [Oligoflexales bacterium]|nr:hypothetical protein [Oligoflexales bacterium]